MRLGDLSEQILDLLPDALAVIDPNGLVVYANKAFNSLEISLYEPGSKKARPELLRLIREGPPGGKGAAPRQVSASFGGKTCEVFVHLINRSALEGRLPLWLIKLGERQKGLAFSAPRDLPAADGQEQPILSEALAPEFGELKGMDPAFRQALLTAQKAARTDFPLLILGESGTGKEILARTIHGASRRSKKPFVDINCAAIPENLIESELFGYEKGAFTGARPDGRRGLFAEAHEGSIFMDEIGDASLQIQAKILRVVEEGRFKRLGGNRNIEVNVRLISATNRDLTALIRESKFREDLFYRLNTITIELPPLRRRPQDILLLIEHFLTEYIRREGKNISFSSDCLELMESYNWPGNVRELKGVVDYAVTMAAGSRITSDCLPSFLLPRPDARRAPGPIPVIAPGDKASNHNLPAAVREVERELIKRVLEKSANRSEAIKTLGISRRTFYLKIKQYGLD
jgi:transcriptional regulator with PAS, ATPase and Fis domain